MAGFRGCPGADGCGKPGLSGQGSAAAGQAAVSTFSVRARASFRKLRARRANASSPVAARNSVMPPWRTTFIAVDRTFCTIRPGRNGSPCSRAPGVRPRRKTGVSFHRVSRLPPACLNRCTLRARPMGREGGKQPGVGIADHQKFARGLFQRLAQVAGLARFVGRAGDPVHAVFGADRASPGGGRRPAADRPPGFATGPVGRGWPRCNETCASSAAGRRHRTASRRQRPPRHGGAVAAQLGRPQEQREREEHRPAREPGQGRGITGPRRVPGAASGKAPPAPDPRSAAARSDGAGPAHRRPVLCRALRRGQRVPRRAVGKVGVTDETGRPSTCCSGRAVRRPVSSTRRSCTA